MDSRIQTESIIEKEWAMFTSVQNIGGRASCQDNYRTFRIMRASQFEAWDPETLSNYSNDLDAAIRQSRNLIAEKYAYMMESSDPEEYAKIAGRLPAVTAEAAGFIREILGILLAQTSDFFREYPAFSLHSRPLYQKDDHIFTSIETYTLGELKTYSLPTLRSYLAHIRSLQARQESIVYRIYENTARCYGYQSVAEAERSIRQ